MFFVDPSTIWPSREPLTPLDTGVLDDAFRVAVCLGATERVATVIAALALRGIRMRAPGSVAAKTRLSVLGRVIREARIAMAGEGARRDAAVFPALASLPLAEREVLVLDLACDLSDADIAEVLSLDAAHVRGLRWSARLALVGRARSMG